MAKYSDIVAGLTVGDYGSTGPTGFTNRFTISPNFQFNVNVDASAPSGKSIEILANSDPASTVSTRTLFSYDAVNSDPDRATSTQVAIIRIRPTAVDTGTLFGGLAARGGGSGGSENMTVGSFGTTASDVEVVRSGRYVNGSPTLSASAATNIWVTGGIYWLKHTVSGTTYTTTLYAENDLDGTVLGSVSNTAGGSNATDWIGIFAFSFRCEMDILYYAIGTGADQPDPPGGVTAPATAPTGLTAAAQSDTVIRLSWNALAGATGYKIRRDGVTVTDVGNVLTFDVVGLGQLQQYGFEVLAYNSAGDGPYSTAVLETTQATPENSILITDIDGGNASTTLSGIVGADTLTPRFNLFARPSTTTGTNGSGWRRMGFAIENVGGKSPVFAIDRANMADNTITPLSTWLPMYTTDGPEVLNPTYVQATSRTLVGGSTGTIEFSFDSPLPAGRVYVMTHPMGAQAQAATLATELLNNYPGVVTPTGSANASGAYFTTPAEVDENGRQIGVHNTYSFKAEFGGATTDGGPKRKLLMIAGVHAAGEQTSFVSFRACLKYILESADAAAVNLRANWDVYCYFNVTANGIFGGHRRHNFRVNTDPNRDYLAKSLAEINALTTAIFADTGGAVDVSFDWHGFASATEDFISWAQDTPQARKFIELGEAIFGSAARAGGIWSTATDTSTGWTRNTLGAKYAVAAEVPQRGNTSDSNYKFIGESWAKTLQATDADGQFYTPVIPQGVITAGTPSVSSTTASVPFTYSASDQTGFVYRLNGGAPVSVSSSPISLSGLTASTPYTIDIAAVNSVGTGTYSVVQNFTTTETPVITPGDGTSLADLLVGVRKLDIVAGYAEEKAINDRLYQFLRSQGFQGTLNDMLKAYLLSLT